MGKCIQKFEGIVPHFQSLLEEFREVVHRKFFWVKNELVPNLFFDEERPSRCDILKNILDLSRL